MSRGKKAKRKMGGRRKQESSVVAASMRLADVERSSRNKSHTLELSSKTSTKSVKCLRWKGSDNIAESQLVITESKADECNEEKNNVCFAETRLNGSNFDILFKSDELQILRSVLRKTDLSKTPLLLGAIILGKVEVVKRLLRDGYPINSRSEEDKTTALMWAVRRKDLEMINLLVRNGADLTLLDENNDNVALIAVQSSSWEQNDFLDFWNSIDRKIDLKHENTSGYTILDYARERQWNVLADLMDRNLGLLTRIDAISKNPCLCCRCSLTSGLTRSKVRQVPLSTDNEMESTLSHLSVLFDEIINRYRNTWSRDRHLGYPDFRGGHGDVASTLKDLVSLRREEIARLNTVLPKLEESYLRKLGDCWSSLIAKMRKTAFGDVGKFQEFVTSIQIQLLTHQVSPVSDENVEFYSTDVADRKSTEFIDFSEPAGNTAWARINDESSYSGNFDICAKVTLNS